MSPSRSSFLMLTALAAALLGAGQLQAAPGMSIRRDMACSPAAICSGSMRLSARFISGVEMP